VPKQNKKEEEHHNPLLQDTREDFGPAHGWLTTPTKEETPVTTVTETKQPEPVTPIQTTTTPVAPPIQTTQPQLAEVPLLYKSEPSAEWLMRTFDQQRHKGALVGNPYLLGAVDAIETLLRYKKYEVHEEMMRDFIEKHKDVLEARPDVVRMCEEKYREKFKL
jgi:hypothetical protein